MTISNASLFFVIKVKIFSGIAFYEILIIAQLCSIECDFFTAEKLLLKRQNGENSRMLNLDYKVSEKKNCSVEISGKIKLSAVPCFCQV